MNSSFCRTLEPEDEEGDQVPRSEIRRSETHHVIAGAGRRACIAFTHLESCYLIMCIMFEVQTRYSASFDKLPQGLEQE